MTDHEHPDDQIEWPREIWMGEREEHDQGVVTAVLSEHATVARWEGDKERDREFHRYVDADIHESAERYYKARIAAAEAAAYRKAAEWHMEVARHDGEGMEYSALVGIPISNWKELDTSVKTHEWCADAILALADTSALDKALAAERENAHRLLKEGCNLLADEYDTIKSSITMPDGSLSKNPLDRWAVEKVEAMDDWILRAGKELAIRKGDQA